jgi:hypothetical protein
MRQPRFLLASSRPSVEPASVNYPKIFAHVLAITLIFASTCVNAYTGGPEGFVCPELLTAEEAQAQADILTAWSNAHYGDGNLDTKSLRNVAIRVMRTHKCEKSLALLEEEKRKENQREKAEEENRRNARYYVESKPDSLIQFKTAYAEKIVGNYNFQCPQPGKSASLMVTLRRSVTEGSAMGGGVRKLYAIVDSRGDEIRVYHQVRGNDGYVGEQSIIMSINKWGELHLRGISKDAMFIDCYR